MLVVGLLFPLVFGFVISLVITSKISLYERLALGYGLGYGLLTLCMFFLNVLGFKFSLINTLALSSVIICLSLLYLGAKNRLGNLYSWKRSLIPREGSAASFLSIMEVVIIGVLVFFMAERILAGLHYPPQGWDALVVYDFRARVFAETCSLPEAALKIINRGYVFPIPPMTSLAHTWLYLWGWTNPKIFYPLLFVSLAVIFYYSLRDYCPRYWCLLFTVILVVLTPLYGHAVSSYANFPFAFYFSIGTFYLYRWMTTQKKGLLVLAGIFLGLSSWVRRESPIFFLGYLVILILFSILRRRFLAPLLFAFLYFSIEPLWRIYLNHVILPPQVSTMVSQSSGIVSLSLGIMRQVFAIITGFWANLRTFSIFLDLGRWREVLIYLQRHVLVPYRTVFYLLILFTLLGVGKARKHFFLLLLVLSNIILFTMGAYKFSLGYAQWAVIGDSARRLFMMFVPIMWYYIALITAEDKLFKRITQSGSMRGKHRDTS